MIKNGKNSLAILILSLLILAAIIFLARPLVFASLATYRQNKDKRAEIESYQKNLTNLKAVESEIENISSTIQKAKNFVPEEANAADFLVQLEAVAQKSNLALTKVDLGEEKETTQPTQPAEEQGTQPAETQKQSQATTKIINVDGAEETVISVELQGRYSRLISFLRNMRRLSRFNIIKNLSIQGGQGEDEKVTASLYVIIFSKK